MNYMFVSFKSRSVVFKAYNFLSSRGVNCTFMSTPRKVYSGCGLSIKFSDDDFTRVKSLLGTNVESFAGYWQVTNVGDKKLIVRVS